MGLVRVCLGGCLVVAACQLSMAQKVKPVAADTAEGSLPSTATLPRGYPVLTVEGACPASTAAKTAASKRCATTVTREDFEELVNAVNPKMTKLERRQLADNYGHMLALSQEAQRRGLDRKPEVRALLNYARMTTLAGAFSKDLYREAQNPSHEEVEKYFAANRPFFTKYSFLRIYIPRERQGGETPAGTNQDLEQSLSDKQGSSADAMKSLADEVQKQAAGGEDFAALQERVFEVAGIKSAVQVKMEYEPGQLPKTQDPAFQLAVGAVSGVLPDDSGFYIYKLLGKQTPELKNVREEVVTHMQTQTTNQALKKIESFAKTRVNEDYFNKYQPPAPNPNEPDVDDD
jgi:hypothetical protein